MRSSAILHLLACGVALAACGPSVRRVHLADEYFERCYAGDRDPAYDDDARRHCWDRWLAYHTVGQSDERVGHARERLLQLDPADSAAVEMATGEMEMELESEGATDEASTPYAEVPVVALTAAATGAETAEPARREERPELRARHRPPTPHVVTTRCDATCRPPWEACVDACHGGDAACLDACRARFRTCAGGCY